VTVDISFDRGLALLGVALAIISWWDARRQRNRRERAVIVAHSVIERTYGLLVGIKPFVSPLGEEHKAAVNNGLAAIDQQRPTLDTL
jgi:hypothetical protein